MADWDEILADEVEKVQKTLDMADKVIDLARKEQKISEDGLAAELESAGPAPDSAGPP